MIILNIGYKFAVASKKYESRTLSKKKTSSLYQRLNKKNGFPGAANATTMKRG